MTKQKPMQPVRKKKKTPTRATVTAAARKLGRVGGLARKKAKPAPSKRRRLNVMAVTLGRLGGLARKRNLSTERASEIGRRAAFARHNKPWPPTADEPAPAAVPAALPVVEAAPHAEQVP
jgi:hypothetical protein